MDLSEKSQSDGPRPVLAGSGMGGAPSANAPHGVARGTRVDPLALTVRAKGSHDQETVATTTSLALAKPVLGDGVRREPWLERWSRRALTLPALLLVIALVLAVTPAALVVALLGDVLKRQPGLWTRFVLLIDIVVLGHLIGLLGLLLVWLFSGRCLGSGGARWLEWNRAVEAWWSRSMVSATLGLYEMRTELDNVDAASTGPMLICSRHASVVDTLLPAALLGTRFGLYMRIVKKYELLYDVAVDILSHRLHRAFVKRNGKKRIAQLVGIRAMTAGMDADDAAVIFPEGTRFTAKKRQRVIEKLSGRQPAMAARAAALKHLLPVRTAGTFAILDARPDLDVVFMAHTGLEGASRLEHFVGGVLYRRTLKVKFWRVPATEVPDDEQARTDWLCDWWQTIDNWIDRNRALS